MDSLYDKFIDETESTFTAGVDKRTLVPGDRYYIRISDCCVSGHLVGVFLGYGELGEPNGYTETRFDFGVLSALDHAWEVYLNLDQYK